MMALFVKTTDSRHANVVVSPCTGAVTAMRAVASGEQLVAVTARTRASACRHPQAHARVREGGVECGSKKGVRSGYAIATTSGVCGEGCGLLGSALEYGFEREEGGGRDVRMRVGRDGVALAARAFTLG